MPVPKKKRITAENALSTSQASSLPLPEQQEFHQHLRALAQSAVRTVLELVMREELDALIGVAWGSVVPNAKAIATAPIRAIWPRQLVGSKISRYPEIVKATSIPRRLNATVAMNRTSPKA